MSINIAYPEKGPFATSKDASSDSSLPPNDGDAAATGSVSNITAGSQALHRKLRGREVQLFAIGGAIGTCKSIAPMPHKNQHQIRQFKLILNV